MPRKPSKTIEEQKYELRMKIAELNEQYQTALYFETMPIVNPNYSYSYQHSNLSIAWEDHSVDAWLTYAKLTALRNISSLAST